jgi:hypothetical protein
VTTTAHADPADTVLASFVDVALAPHAQGGPGPVRQLSVSGTLRRSGSLQLQYRLSAALDQVRLVPSTCHAQRRDELWHHTCFELFAARDGEAAYCEFNFTPAGDWAAYSFASYRAARQDAPQRRLEVTTRASGHDGLLRLHAALDLGAALGLDAAALAAAAWQFNAAVIVEDVSGERSYWAVHHPRTQPDFHDREGFRIALAGPARASAGGRP